MSALGTTENPLRVAIIGAGPSGFYATDHLLKQTDVVVKVDLFDRLPTPYGLVRNGVACSLALFIYPAQGVPALLAESWHAQGRLTELPESEPCRRAYWLVAPLPQWRQKKVRALVAFLTGG